MGTPFRPIYAFPAIYASWRCMGLSMTHRARNELVQEIPSCSRIVAAYARCQRDFGENAEFVENAVSFCLLLPGELEEHLKASVEIETTRGRSSGAVARS